MNLVVSLVPHFVGHFVLHFVDLYLLRTDESRKGTQTQCADCFDKVFDKVRDKVRDKVAGGMLKGA